MSVQKIGVMKYRDLETVLLNSGCRRLRCLTHWVWAAPNGARFVYKGGKSGDDVPKAVVSKINRALSGKGKVA